MIKNEIKKDFIAKKNSYYKNNYLKKTKSNYLRRYRNSLIKKNVAKIKNVENVLDIGCGPAILYPEVLDRCKNYFALDLVKSNLEKIRSQNSSEKISFIKADLDNFNPKRNQYDLIICSGSLEYTVYPEKIIEKLIKSIKLNGTLIISLPNKLSPYRNWNQYVYKNFKKLLSTLTKTDYINYKRNLFTENSIRKTVPKNTKKESIYIEYFGLKILLQPLDMIFKNIDYNILKYFNNKPFNFFLKFSSEFIIFYKKEKD